METKRQLTQSQSSKNENYCNYCIVINYSPEVMRVEEDPHWNVSPLVSHFEIHLTDLHTINNKLANKVDTRNQI
jgi:hypothetical protein